MKGHSSITRTPTILAAFVVVVLSLANQLGWAQTYCIPNAQGVPPNWNPPNWWDPSPPQPAYSRQIDDPRWNAGLRFDYPGTSGSEEGYFRAVQAANVLLFSWHCHIKAGTTANQNVLFVGFRQQGAVGANDVILRVELHAMSTTADGSMDGGPNGSRVVTILSRQAGPNGQPGNDITPNPHPVWLDQTRVWINTPFQNSYTVNMRIPIDDGGLAAGLNLDPTGFKMWFEVLSGVPGQMEIEEAFPVNALVTQTLSGYGYPDPDDAATPGHPNQWLLYSIGGGASCVGGVSLASQDIGTLNTDPSVIATNKQNTFFAHPLNNTGAPIPAGTIKGRFRIANWGSQPNWEDVPVGTTLWETLIGSDPPVPDSGQFEAPAGSATANGNHADIHFLWPEPWPVTNPPSVADQQFLDFVSGISNGTKRPHQCMLVELSGGTGPGFFYANSSVVRNMNFGTASVLQDVAAISVRGVPQIAGRDHHDVYLYVEKVNMPPPQNNPLPTPNPRSIPKDVFAEMARANTGNVTLAAIQSAYNSHRITSEQLETFMPTCRVHAYRDIGTTITINGTEHKLLKPETSFGYYVFHDGNLYGWDTQLIGAQKIAENFYKVGVPLNGTVNVTVRIAAVDTPIRCCHLCVATSGLGLGMATIGMTLLGMVAYWPRRKK
jgi:hypothetical protein